MDKYSVAQTAFVVQDGEQRKGIGTQLLAHLALLAWKGNVEYFACDVSKENRDILSIFRKADPGMEYINSDGSVGTITLSVV